MHVGDITLKVRESDSADDKEKGEKDADTESINEPLVPDQKPVRAKWWEWWLSLCINVKKVKKIKKASKKVKGYLDISKMLTKFIQFERIVDLFLTEDQKSVFENLPPPPFKEEPDLSPKKRRELLNQGIIKLLKKEERDHIDEKLLQLYEKIFEV